MDGKAAENGKKRGTLTRVKKCAVGIFGAGAVLYCAVLAFAAVFADRIIFPAPIASYTESMEDLRFVPLSGGGKMAAVFLPSAKSDICVIYSHGNGEDLGRIKGVLSGYNTRGFNVLAYDYRGYGLTGGTASQRALEECADAAYDFAVKTLGFAPEKIAFVGYSLGSVPAAYSAAKHPDAKCAVIVGGIAGGVKTFLPFNIIPWRILMNVDNVKNIRIPTLFIHGMRDGVVNRRNVFENLAAAKNAPARLVKFEKFGHYNLHRTPEYWRETTDFINGKNNEKNSSITIR